MPRGIRESPGFFEEAMTDAKIRDDSLYARLKKAGLLDDFFAFVAADEPGYKELHAWCDEHRVKTSNGGLHTCITHHMAVWRTRKAISAVEEEDLALPADTDDKVRERLRGLRLDLSLRDLSEKTAVTLLKLDFQERELAAKNQTAREAGVQALMAEAEGNDAAKAALSVFLAALETARAKGGAA
jgi:hypothetical protein